MSHVHIDTALVRSGADDLDDVARKIGQAIQTAISAQEALRGYESQERAPQIKAKLNQWLGQVPGTDSGIPGTEPNGAPAMQQRMQSFAEFLRGVASTYEQMG